MFNGERRCLDLLLLDIHGSSEELFGDVVFAERIFEGKIKFVSLFNFSEALVRVLVVLLRTPELATSAVYVHWYTFSYTSH